MFAVLAVTLAACTEPPPRHTSTDAPGNFATARAMLVEQVRGDGVRDPRVLAAMGAIPREAFVPAAERGHAYENRPLPIGRGQTISQPTVVGMMTEALELMGTERVLEIGTGSGYQAAVLARLGREVRTIEIDPQLAAAAAQRLTDLGTSNIIVRAGDGFFGWPDAAPFDAILVTAATPRIPRPLLEQLAEGGRLVAPVEQASGEQTLVRVIRRDGRSVHETLAPVVFVPMTGAVRQPPRSLSE